MLIPLVAPPDQSLNHDRLGAEVEEEGERHRGRAAVRRRTRGRAASNVPPISLHLSSNLSRPCPCPFPPLPSPPPSTRFRPDLLQQSSHPTHLPSSAPLPPFYCTRAATRLCWPFRRRRRERGVEEEM
ncbi:unnamed protein product [Closterium sp. NIES-53]